MNADLVVEILRRIQADIADLKDGQAQIRVQLSAIGQQLAGLTTAV